MAVLRARDFPGAYEDPLAYPGERPVFSYVYRDGLVHEVSPVGPRLEDLFVDTGPVEIPIADFLAERRNPPLEDRVPVLAIGSNGCPGRLAEKLEDDLPDASVPVLAGTLEDTAVVYLRWLAPYAALPATLLQVPGAVSHVSLTLLSRGPLLATLDGSEPAYRRVEVDRPFRIEGGAVIEGCTAYVNPEVLVHEGKPILLKMFAESGLDWPVMDDAGVLRLVLDEAGILPGEPIEMRQARVRSDPALRARLSAHLERKSGGVAVDEEGRFSFAPEGGV